LLGLENVDVVEGKTPVQFLQEMIDANPNVETHSVVNLGSVIHQLKNWKQLLPRVAPFYGMKLLIIIPLSLCSGFLLYPLFL
jgi:hypothetical protein